MYSMVLMAAMLPSGDTASFGKHKGGCDGGCSGVVASSGCSGKAKGGFLGHKDKGGCNGRSNGCNGSSNGCNGGGFLGLHKNKGGCNGTPVQTCDHCGVPAGCVGSPHGGSVVPPPPVVMPKPEVKPEVKPKPKTGD